MKSVLLKTALVLLAAVCLVSLFAAIAPAAEERVVDLPNDGAKWHLSIVGNVNDPVYAKTLSFFYSHEKLNTLKKQVHFYIVNDDTATFRDRYAATIRELPTVRMQMPDGVVIYERTGRLIPSTPAELYSEIANAVRNAQLPCPFNRCRPRPAPAPAPEPAPMPPRVDPPAPPLNDFIGPPVVDEPAPATLPPGAIIAIVAGCMFAGGCVGLVRQWKRTYAKM